MKVLELFSGTELLSREFRSRGHEAYTVDYNPQFPSSLHQDIGTLTAEQVLRDFGKPDVIFAAFDCTTFSLMAMHHHRLRNGITGECEAVSWQAREADRVDKHCLQLIETLNPKVFIIENPVGGLRTMKFMQGIPRYTTTYCQYGAEYKKPTDFFSNIDLKLKPCCCHKYHSKSVKGLKDSMERSMYPQRLVEHIVDVCEEAVL